MNNRQQQLAAAFVAICLTGCATRPPQVLTPELVPKTFDAPVAARTPVWPSAGWWREFGSPELSVLITRAQADNRNLAAAAARLREATAEVTIQRAALFPQFDLEGDAIRAGVGTSAVQTGSQHVSTGNAFSLNLDASYDPDVWGLQTDNLRSATEALKSSRFAQQVTALTVTAAVADGYFNVLALREQISIAREDIAAIDEILGTIRLKVTAGTASHLDLAQEEAQVESVRAELPVLEEQELEARVVLAVLLGRPPESFDVLAPNSDGLTLPAAAAGLPSQLLLRRPDVAEAEANLAAAHANLQAARAAFLPQIALGGSDGFGSTAVSTLWHGPSAVWDAGAQLVQTIFAGGKLVGQKNLAYATQQELVADYQAAVLNAYADVESALGQVANYAREEEHLRREVAAAREAFGISQLQYRQGVADLGMRPPGSWAAVYGLAVIALLIVVVACCNFMNLATARATLRAREVAVRKVAGAGRRQLMAQFLGEAVVTALVSLVVAFSLVEVLLPSFGRFLGAPIALHYRSDWRLLAGLTAGAVAVGLLSGFYPALVMSALRPGDALKAGASVRSGSEFLRSALVVAQFAISIGLAVAAVVVLRQIDFARHVDLGIRRNGIVVVQGIAKLTPGQRATLADALQSNPRIETVAYSLGSPFGLHGFYTRIDMPDKAPLQAEMLNMSPAFPVLYGIPLLAGRQLSVARPQDASTFNDFRNVLINATMARRLGLSLAQAVGTHLRGLGDHATVVGVLGDANLKGVRDPLEPMIFWFDPTEVGAMTDLSMRVRPDQLAATLSFIDRTWRQIQPDAVIQRQFLTQTFAAFFSSVDREGTLLGLCVSIAVFIACLGLFGLALFTAERHTKEVGVRKVAGARTSEILMLMLWRISIPVLAANLIAWPVAYYCLHRWLEGYAYRVPLNPLYFLATGAAALVIAWATVYVITLRLARTNPIHALRYE